MLIKRYILFKNYPRILKDLIVSHGIASEIIVYNLVSEIKPDSFGYVDHDWRGPFKKFDLSSHISGMIVMATEGHFLIN